MFKNIFIKGAAAMVAPILNRSVVRKVDTLLTLVRGAYPDIVEILGMDNTRKACYFWLALNGKIGITPPKDKSDTYRTALKFMQQYINGIYSGEINKGMPLEAFVLMQTIKGMK